MNNKQIIADLQKQVKAKSNRPVVVGVEQTNYIIEQLKKMNSYKAILEQVVSDVADLQNSGEEDGLPALSELGKFYDRMCANATDIKCLIGKAK